MSLIKKEIVLNGGINYLGVLIGAISMVFIYPLIDTDILGLIQFSINTSAFLMAFTTLGLSLTAVRFFENFKDYEHKHNGFLGILLILVSGISLLFIGLISVFKHEFAPFFGKESDKFLYSFNFILFYTVALTVSNILTAYISNFNKITVPTLLSNLLFKVSLPIFVYFLSTQFFNLSQVFWALTSVYCFMLLGLFIYLNQLKELFLIPNWQFVTPKLRGEMMNYSFYNILVTLGATVIIYTDKLLIAPMLGFTSLTIFSFAYFIAEAIDIPRKTIASIASPTIAKAMLHNNIAEISTIYRRSAIIQLVFGVLLLAGTMACCDFIFDLMPKNGALFKTGKTVILLLGASRLFDMATSVNSEIITYSNYYRFNMVSLILMAIINIAFNLWLIPIYGIEGSALATVISIVVINSVKVFYIYKKIGVQPFQFKMLLIVFMGVFFAYLTTYFPIFNGSFLNIILRGSFVLIGFMGFIILANISEDVNQVLRKMGVLKE